MLSIYKASAGSGKTFTLTREYLRMLLMDRSQSADNRLSHSRILAVTFTKKSTAEMKERILRELYILSQTPEKSDYIQDFLQDKRIGMTLEQIQQYAQQMLIHILHDYTHFSVSTIDGFFQQVIRTFAMELGLSASYDVSLDGEEIVQQAVDDLFKRIKDSQHDNQDLLAWLTEYAKKNIEDDKRWNPSNSIKQFSTQLLKEQLIRQMDKIQLAFANKDLMRQYHQQLTHLIETAQAQVTQVLEQCQEILRPQEGWNSNFYKALHRPASRWLNADFSSDFLKVFHEESPAYAKTKTSKAQQDLLTHIYTEQLSPLCSELMQLCTGQTARNYVSANLILPNLYTMGILQDVAKQIEETNRNIGRLPISETNKLVHQIIDGQDTPFIYERIGQYFRHYMIDEFQDTSQLQWQNFSPLIHESESQNHDNLIVGDVKQSIYRFRNSDWHLLGELPKYFQRIKMPDMKYNFRTASLIINENEKLLERYSIWVADRIQEDTQVPQLAQDIRHMYSPQQMHQDAYRTYDGYFYMQFVEGTDYVESIKERVYQQLLDLQQEGIDLQRVALLFRYNSEAADFAEYLIDKGINVQSAEGLRVCNHPTIQLLIHLLQWSCQEDNSIYYAYIKQQLGPLTQKQEACILHARELSLYEQVQSLIDGLQLHKRAGVTPYLTTFQDYVYRFMQKRVADRQLFLEYWERNKHKVTISAPPTSDAVRIISIHNSKGLEFDIVFLPLFTWELMRMHPSDYLWCTPTTAPFNTLPLVAVHPSNKLLLSHFADDYIQEMVAQYTDNLNLTYVALTRPRYRLYVYGQMCPVSGKGPKISNIGHLISYLYRSELSEELSYSILPATMDSPAPLPPLKTDNTPSRTGRYVSTAIGDRLRLRSRSEDDFAADAPLEIVDLGILMHLWLSYIRTWEDADTALQRLLRTGQVTEKQATEMREQLRLLQHLIQQEGHDDWFTGQYRILSEQDILTPSGNMHRPDRVMIREKHAIVIDYKFGYEQPISHQQQVRDYMLLLSQMGYTIEGHIIYVAHHKIYTIS